MAPIDAAIHIGLISAIADPADFVDTIYESLGIDAAYRIRQWALDLAGRLEFADLAVQARHPSWQEPS